MSDDKETLIKKLSHSIGDEIKEWTGDWTAHGFGNIVRTKKWSIRIFWLIILMGFLGFLIFSKF